MSQVKAAGSHLQPGPRPLHLSLPPCRPSSLARLAPCSSPLVSSARSASSLNLPCLLQLVKSNEQATSGTKRQRYRLATCHRSGSLDRAQNPNHIALRTGSQHG